MHLYNLTTLHRQPGSRLKTTRGGVQSYNPSYIAKTSVVVAEHDALKLGQKYEKVLATDPNFPGLLLEEKEILFDEGDQATLLLTWEGVTSETLPPPFWRIVRTPQEEPIESHRRFVSSIGGTATNPLNGAVFDSETGLFEGFPMTANANLRGVSKYLAENIVVTKEYVAINQPNDNFEIPIIRTPRITEIDPLDPDAVPDRGIEAIPSIPLGYNWLQTDLVYTRRGNVYEITEEYTASGIGGWNSLIYATF